VREAGDLASRVDGIAVGVGMGVPAIAKVNFTSQDRVRNVIHNFNAGWFVSQYPTQAEPELRQVKPPHQVNQETYRLPSSVIGVAFQASQSAANLGYAVWSISSRELGRPGVELPVSPSRRAT
jgi:hypothetical protein